MAIFPQIAPNSFEEDDYIPLNGVSFNGGYEQTVSKFSRNPQIFYMTFSSLTVEKATEIRNFLLLHKGISFSFIHPLTYKTYEVKFKEEKLKIKWESPLYRSTSIILYEV
ncbi:hypothetical protein AFAEC_0599 [Aliarcobacter faecis]|uniref:hypothetical protein n=1 Tax=Aliarcobacter faecis TaxID=1564138 RepID=UPI00047B6137|nr:hypothetical protein [Aliarcobacter faecis]QKF72790.1 hypothetical protein AFAEC_0599 [Aliarcobacter faecis]